MILRVPISPKVSSVKYESLFISDIYKMCPTRSVTRAGSTST